MRIILDLQGAQGENYFRGIGRYALSLANAIRANAPPGYEILAGLNRSISSNMDDIRQTLSAEFDHQDIVTWSTPAHDRSRFGNSADRMSAAQVLQDAAIAGFHPDLVHQSSLMEGFHDNAVSHLRPRFGPFLRSATFFDAIPAIYPETYLTDAVFAEFYRSRMKIYQELDLVLAISRSAGQEAIDFASVAPERLVNIMAASDSVFSRSASAGQSDRSVLKQLGVPARYVMYAGGYDRRKNIHTLIRAFARMKKSVRSDWCLVLAGKIPPNIRDELSRFALSVGLASSRVRFLEYVTDEQMAALYRGCGLFVLPSHHEGFGLPALEAMSCGTPVLAADSPGLRELVVESEAMFDPDDHEALSEKIELALTDAEFRKMLCDNGETQAARYSWERSAKLALDAFSAARQHAMGGQVHKIRRVAILMTAFESDASATRNMRKLISELAAGFAVDVVAPDPDLSLIGLGELPASVRKVRLQDFEQDGERYQWIAASLASTEPCAWITRRLIDQPLVLIAHSGDVDDLYAACELPHCLSKNIRLQGLGWNSLTAFGELTGDDALEDWTALMVVMSGLSPAILPLGLTAERAAKLSELKLDRWEFVADGSYVDWINKTEARCLPKIGLNAQAAALETLTFTAPDARLQQDIAASMSSNVPIRKARRQLLVDVSHLAVIDAKSGIQRVVRAILGYLMSDFGDQFDIRPVAARGDRGYHYANEFAARFLGVDINVEDRPVDVCPGDIFLGLDLTSDVAHLHEDWFNHIRKLGAKVVFVIYDLLPNLSPQYFPDTVVEAADRWLRLVLRSADQAVCISRTVAAELKDWSSHVEVTRDIPLQIDSWPLGADIEASKPSSEDMEGGEEILAKLSQRPSVLMVGTIEPRKGHDQALAAFTELWKRGTDVNLVIIGKAGWNVDELLARLRTMASNEPRLIWCDNASDAFLQKVYAASGGVLVASRGEGFGLPIIEARAHGKPVLARDLPVFREVANDTASFFSAITGEKLANAILEWMVQWPTLNVEASFEATTWKASAAALLRKINV